jgi:hypothetical protein
MDTQIRDALTALLIRWQARADEARARAEHQPDHKLVKYWYGVAFGYESAADELRTALTENVVGRSNGNH